MMSSGIRVSPIEAPAMKATSSTGERPRARATPNATGWTARAGARPRSLAEVEFRKRPGHRLQPEYRAYGGAHGVGIYDDDAALAYGRHLLGDGIGLEDRQLLLNIVGGKAAAIHHGDDDHRRIGLSRKSVGEGKKG